MTGSTYGIGLYAPAGFALEPAAILRAPCWVGDHVFVDKEAVIGPFAIVEDRAFIERAVRVARSWIGPETLVGQYAQVANAFAFGNALIDWSSGLVTEITEPFVQCALSRPKQPRLRL
jgi:NDP-sugar pyrophosphorylase family protein